MGFCTVLLMMATLCGSVYLKMDALTNTLSGGVVAGFMTVLNHYFGSSRSSQAKDDTIARQLPK